jgi:hypothetical protein
MYAMAVVLPVLLCRPGFRGFVHLAGGLGSLFAVVVLLGEHPVHGRTTHAERGGDCRDRFTAVCIRRASAAVDLSSGHCQLEQSEGDFRRFASAIHQVACDV